MSSIILSSTELENFKEIVEYIVFQQEGIRNIADIGTTAYHEKIAVLINSKGRTISNKYSSGIFIIKRRYFNDFCRRASDFFEAQETTKTNQIKQELFKKWQLGIVNRLSLDHEEIANEELELNNEIKPQDQRSNAFNVANDDLDKGKKSDKISEAEFLTSLATIRKYYEENCYQANEIRGFQLLDQLVKNRDYETAGYYYDAADFFNYGSYGWEIYELLDEKIIIRQLNFMGNSLVEGKPFFEHKFLCNVVYGKQGMSRFPTDLYNNDNLELAQFDNLQQTLEITRDTPIDKKLADYFNFSYRKFFSNAFVGHRGSFIIREKHQLEIKVTPAVLYSKSDTKQQTENIYQELDIYDKQIPDVIRSILMNWKDINLEEFPFKYIPITFLNGLEELNMKSIGID